MPVRTKRCIECNRVLPRAAFWDHVRSADGKFHRCKSCATPRTGPNATVRDGETWDVKFCPKCKKTLPAEHFQRNRSNSSGLQTYCKGCADTDLSGVTHKVCRGCKKLLPLSEYHKCGNGTQGCCKPCNTEMSRAGKFKNKFDITVEEYDAMVAAQKGLCAICGKPETRLANNRSGEFTRLCVDHYHNTGKVCKLLCYNCNAGLGLFSDDPRLLEAAARYVKYHRGG
jgi:phage FluMu protein Com